MFRRMPGRVRRFIEHQIMSVITLKRPLRKRMPDTTVNGEEKAAEVSGFRHQVITEMARIRRGDPEPSFPSNPSREELAVAVVFSVSGVVQGPKPNSPAPTATPTPAG